MSLVFALAAGLLVGTGAYLTLSRDLVRVVLGVVIISQAAILALIASGLTVGAAPIGEVDGPVSDPLSQAMALTAIVIGLAVTTLLLVLVLRVTRAVGSPDLDELADEEMDREARLEERLASGQRDEEAAAR